MTTRQKVNNNINNNINININKNNNITDLLRKSFFIFCRHAFASHLWASHFLVGACVYVVKALD